MEGLEERRKQERERRKNPFDKYIVLNVMLWRLLAIGLLGVCGEERGSGREREVGRVLILVLSRNASSPFLSTLMRESVCERDCARESEMGRERERWGKREEREGESDTYLKEREGERGGGAGRRHKQKTTR